jgi:glycosyltransferase involved in cell wall biosynthesis
LSIPAWESRLTPYTLGRRVPFEWLPIPSNIEVRPDLNRRQAIHRRYAASGQTLLGHFGTYGKTIKEMLKAVLPDLLREREDLSVLLLGRHSEDFRSELTQACRGIEARLHATGGLEAVELSRHVSACDIMLQPYPDGVSTRRGSAMISLIHGKPLVTTAGFLTESLWVDSEAVALAPATEVHALKEQVNRLLDDVKRRQDLGEAANQLYRERFDVRHTIRRLRDQRLYRYLEAGR